MDDGAKLVPEMDEERLSPTGYGVDQNAPRESQDGV
jgi:hypothetical protein